MKSNQTELSTPSPESLVRDFGSGTSIPLLSLLLRLVDGGAPETPGRNRDPESLMICDPLPNNSIISLSPLNLYGSYHL